MQKSFRLFLFGIFPLMYPHSLALGQLSTFSVLGGSTVTSTNATAVTGNLGVSPGTAVTGFPPGSVSGTIHAGNSTAAQAQSELTTLYNQLAATTCTVDLTGQNLGGLILTPGVYCFNTSAQLTGTLTLNAQNNPNAIFIFKIGSTLTTASGSLVQRINSTSNCGGVSWQVGSSATLGTGTSFIGSIVALTSITLNTNAGVNGKILARNGAVTLDTNAVSLCNTGPGPGLAPPTLTKTFGAANTALNGTTGLSFTVSNPNAGASLTGVGFSDNLPAGLVVAVPNGLTGSCGGGSITATAGSGNVSLSGANLASSGQCTFSVTVTATTLGVKNNTTSNVTANETVPGPPATASTTVLTSVSMEPVGVPAMSLPVLGGLALLLAGLGTILARKSQGLSS